MGRTVVIESDEHLEQAWRMLHHPSWPATFAETMADPLRARLVRLFAHQIAQRPTPQAARPGNPFPQPKHEHHLPAPRRFTPAPGYVDHKRAAAGDRDD